MAPGARPSGGPRSTGTPAVTPVAGLGCTPYGGLAIIHSPG